MEKIGGKKTVSELKRELQRVMEALVADDDGDLGITDCAIQTLCALKELKQSDLGFMELKNLEFEEAPHEFRCPISGILMKDPVVAASGQTFEELSVKKWLNEGNTKCPRTDEPLPHTILIPNLSIKKLIMNWCKSRSNDEPRISPSREEEFKANATTQERLIELLEHLSSSLLSDQVAAMRELRFLTARFPFIRALFGEMNGAISRLLSPVLIKRCYSHPVLCEDMVTTILNVSIDHSCKTKILKDSTLAISFLSEALRSKESETRAAAAGALSSLSTIDSNKAMIGASGAFKPLIKLLEEGHPLAVKDAALALLSLCTSTENRERALSQGVITAIIDKIEARLLLDEMLEILARFASHQRAVDEMEARGMVSCLVSIAREDVSERCKENCVAIVYAMCFSDPRKIYRVENARETLARVARNGTSRAKRKASGLLERMNRLAFTPYTA